VDLPVEEWANFFRELRDCSVLDVCLAGGEPFLREDLREIISAICRNNLRFSILTNGTLIGKDIAEYLAATKRCNSVQVSIDGSTPAIHDSIRGSGNFKRTLAGINNLQESGLPTTVRVTIHKNNLYDLENIAYLLLEDLGLSSFGTNSASYFGLCRKNSDNLQLDAEELSIAMAGLLKLNKKYNNRIKAMAGPLAEARHWLAMEKARSQGLGSLPGRGRLVGCGCPMHKIAVRSDGVIVPCIMLGHIELGRINQDNLEKVWQSHPELNNLRERRTIRLSRFKFCAGCDYINYCTGNCPALAWTMLWKVNHPSPDACLRKFLDKGGRLPEEALMEYTAKC